MKHFDVLNQGQTVLLSQVENRDEVYSVCYSMFCQLPVTSEMLLSKVTYSTLKERLTSRNLGLSASPLKSTIMTEDAGSSIFHRSLFSRIIPAIFILSDQIFNFRNKETLKARTCRALITAFHCIIIECNKSGRATLSSAIYLITVFIIELKTAKQSVISVTAKSASQKEQKLLKSTIKIVFCQPGQKYIIYIDRIDTVS